MSTPIVLAYSGGLRSSVAIPWLADRHAAGVVAVTLDIGQSTDLAEIRDRALAAGALRAHVLDARDEFARDFVWPSLRAGALLDGRYPMATALSRPLIAAKLVEIAGIEGAAVVAHGSTGRDRARLLLPVRTLGDSLQVTACADGMTAAQVAEYADRLGMSVPDPEADRVDDNLWARTISRSADAASGEVPEAIYTRSRSLAQSPDSAAVVELSFESGTPAGINGVIMTAAELIDSLSTIAGEHGVGRLDRIKHREDGSRTRVIYEAPAAAVLHQAHRELALLTAPASLTSFAASAATAYAAVLGRGEWFGRLRLGLDAFVSATQAPVSGTVRVRLFKGSCHIIGRTVNR